MVLALRQKRDRGAARHETYYGPSHTRNESAIQPCAGGRGFHTEAFSHCTEMPREHEQAVIAEHSKKHEPEA